MVKASNIGLIILLRWLIYLIDSVVDSYISGNGTWFEPRSLSRLCGLIVRVRVVSRRTVVGDIDRRFNNLSGSYILVSHFAIHTAHSFF